MTTEEVSAIPLPECAICLTNVSVDPVCMSCKGQHCFHFECIFEYVQALLPRVALVDEPRALGGWRHPQGLLAHVAVLVRRQDLRAVEEHQRVVEVAVRRDLVGGALLEVVPQVRLRLDGVGGVAAGRLPVVSRRKERARRAPLRLWRAPSALAVPHRVPHVGAGMVSVHGADRLARAVLVGNSFDSSFNHDSLSYYESPKILASF